MYGVRQRYDAYCNVIPIFAERRLRGQDVLIIGDGEQTRDFVNVRDVARANCSAAQSEKSAGSFSLGSGKRISINELATIMSKLTGSDSGIIHDKTRPGDIRDNLAAVEAARSELGYEPSVALAGALTVHLNWLRVDSVTRTRWESMD